MARLCPLSKLLSSLIRPLTALSPFHLLCLASQLYNSSVPSHTLSTLSVSQELPGFSQPIEEEEALLDTLRPTSPSSLYLNSISHLPIFRGKEIISTPSDAGTSNTNRGIQRLLLGLEGLPLRFPHYKLEVPGKRRRFLCTQQPDTILPTQDGKALRAMKALARSK
jgi:hypothetical protein